MFTPLFCPKVVVVNLYILLKINATYFLQTLMP